MPTTTLSGTTPAQLPTRPMTLIVERDGGAGAPIEIVVAPTIETKRPRPDMLVIPRVDQPLAVSIRPRNGGVFETPTVVHLTAMVTDAVAGDHDRVILPSVAVSGLPVLDLLLLEPRGNQVSVRRAVDDELPALPPAGEAALLATRSIIGVTRLPDDQLLDLRILIDASASMGAALADGSVRLAIDLLTGLAPVIGRRSRLDVVVMAADASQPLRGEATHLSTDVEQALRTQPLGSGFVVSGAAPPAGPDTLTYIVTDSVPIDHEQLAASGHTYHAVVLAASDAAGVLAQMSRIPVTVIDAARADSLLGPDGSGSMHLEQILRGLLSSLHREVPLSSGGRP